MTCESAQDRFAAYVADRLSPASRLELEEHLAACAECRASLRTQRELLGQVAALPRSIEPPDALWPAIAGRLFQGKTAGSRVFARWWQRPAWLAAAAVLVVAVSVSVTRWWVGRPSGAAAAALIAPRDYQVFEAQYVRASAEMLDAVRRDPRLTPATRAALDRSLAVIDAALAEAREALARDPASAELREVVLGAHRQKLDLLRRATAFAVSM